MFNRGFLCCFCFLFLSFLFFSLSLLFALFPRVRSRGKRAKSVQARTCSPFFVRKTRSKERPDFKTKVGEEGERETETETETERELELTHRSTHKRSDTTLTSLTKCR